VHIRVVFRGNPSRSVETDDISQKKESWENADKMAVNGISETLEA
jgi:hypothetical protein